MLSCTKNHSIFFIFLYLSFFVTRLRTLLLRRTSSVAFDISGKPTRCFATSFALVRVFRFQRKTLLLFYCFFLLLLFFLFFLLTSFLLYISKTIQPICKKFSGIMLNTCPLKILNFQSLSHFRFLVTSF